PYGRDDSCSQDDDDDAAALKKMTRPLSENDAAAFSGAVTRPKRCIGSVVVAFRPRALEARKLLAQRPLGSRTACCRSTWSRRLRTSSRRPYEGSGVGLARAPLRDEDWAVSPRMV